MLIWRSPEPRQLHHQLFTFSFIQQPSTPPLPPDLFWREDKFPKLGPTVPEAAFHRLCRDKLMDQSELDRLVKVWWYMSHQVTQQVCQSENLSHDWLKGKRMNFKYRPSASRKPLQNLTTFMDQTRRLQILW